MEYVILDLEWNSGYCKKTEGYINEIIEFGAVKLNEDMQITDRFTALVKPDITKRLNHMVRKLTGITDRELKNGESFTKVFGRFRRFLGDAVLLSWSISDISTLEQNCGYYFGNNKIPGLKYYADIQLYCQDMLDLKSQGTLSLSSAFEMLSNDTSFTQAHRAIDDCMLEAYCMKRLYLYQAILCYIRKADDSFYESLHHHGVMIPMDVQKPMLKKVHFNCPSCGARCIRCSEWELKVKGFFASFRCPLCSNEFNGRVSFKQKSEGIITSKHIAVEKDSAEK